MISASPRGALLLALWVEHPKRVRAAVFITPQLWIEPGFARPFISGEHQRYEAMEKFNPNYWRQDYCRFQKAAAPASEGECTKLCDLR